MSNNVVDISVHFFLLPWVEGSLKTYTNKK